LEHQNDTHTRGAALQMREVLNTVMRRDLRFVDDEMMPYYQDVCDHVLRATEWTDWRLRRLLLLSRRQSLHVSSGALLARNDTPRPAGDCHPEYP
jgi:magnesium transporter